MRSPGRRHGARTGGSDLVAVVVVAAVAAIVLRFLGWQVAPVVFCCALLGGGLVTLALSALTLPRATTWPDPAQPWGPTWMGQHAQVRRLGRLVQGARNRDEPVLREALADELGRRLVARHGADPADPLAEAERVAPDLAKAIRTPGRLGTARLTRLLDQLEDL